MVEQLNPDYLVGEDDEDPFAVVFVVDDARDEAGNIAAEADILQASSDALVQMLTSEDKVITARIEEWVNGRIRKIVKRARGSAWMKADAVALTHFSGEHNGARVLVFAPMRISEQPKEIKRLQVTGLNSANAASASVENEPHLLVQVNASLEMSTGKTVAQVGHAVQLFLMYADKEHIQSWHDSGARLKVVKIENLSSLSPTGIIVRDAGFTEVPSGSLTAAANYKES